jgi:hypothetical protein
MLMPHSSPILAMIQQEFVGYHPLLAIARIAHVTDDIKLEFECHKHLSKYVAPELKSLELSAPADEHRRVKVTLFDVIEVEEYIQIEG